MRRFSIRAQRFEGSKASKARVVNVVSRSLKRREPIAQEEMQAYAKKKFKARQKQRLKAKIRPPKV